MKVKINKQTTKKKDENSLKHKDGGEQSESSLKTPQQECLMILSETTAKVFFFPLFKILHNATQFQAFNRMKPGEFEPILPFIFQICLLLYLNHNILRSHKKICFCKIFSLISKPEKRFK